MATEALRKHEPKLSSRILLSPYDAAVESSPVACQKEGMGMIS